MPQNPRQERTWPRVPRQISRGEGPRPRQLLLLREVAARRGRVRVRRGEEEPLERVEAAKMQEEETLHVKGANAESKLVRERVQREGEQVTGDGHREVVEVMPTDDDFVRPLPPSSLLSLNHPE